MKHQVIITADEWPTRDSRVHVDFDVRVHCDGGPVEAQILNLSADGFRLHSARPITPGSQVTLEVSTQFPVKALICWASGLESGGVFAEAVTL